jgi:hypothetical protein
MLSEIEMVSGALTKCPVRPEGAAFASEHVHLASLAILKDSYKLYRVCEPEVAQIS